MKPLSLPKTIPPLFFAAIVAGAWSIGFNLQAKAAEPSVTGADKVLFELLDSTKNGYLSGTELTPEVKQYDANGDGRVLFEEFASVRAKGSGAPGEDTSRPAIKPGGAVPPAAAVPAKLPELPPLKPKAGFITGRAVFADGRPIPKFMVTAGGWAGEIHLGQGGTIPTLGQTTGQKGAYEIQPTSAFDRTKLLKEAVVTTVSSEALFSYNNRDYRLEMHPIDGKLDRAGVDHFQGKTSTGVVRDFVLKMSGPKRGFEKNTPPTDTGSNEMSDPSFGAFYGGVFWLELDPRQGDQTGMAVLKGSKVNIVLTPSGTLLDGSAAQVVDRTYTITEESSVGQSFYFRDIPLGDYTTTVTVTKPGAAAFPLRLRVPGGEWQTSAAVVFEPSRFGYTDAARILCTR